jgi:phosphoenolpyruvate synthase/pyruvate phosphate dikinase
MHAAEAILTAKGGMTSHAALVARGWGKCCIVGCADLNIDFNSQEMRVNNKVIKKGDWAYEAAGSLHEATSHPKDTLYLANIYGPVIFLKEDDSIDFILDWRSYRDMDAAARKLAAEQ